MNNVLQKTKSNTLDNIAAKWYDNSTDNQPGVIARLNSSSKYSNSSSASEQQQSKVEYTYGWYSTSGGK
jgi:hypothetical protein